MPVAYSIASGSDTLPDGGMLSSRATSDAVSFVSARLPISTASACTAASVCFSFGRLSARPVVTLSHMSFAAASCSRASRRIGCRRTTSAFSTSADGISAASPKAFCTACTDGATGALTAT